MCTYRESGFHIPVACPLCGQNLTTVNGCNPGPLRAVAIAACLGCSREFTVSVRLEQMPRIPDAAERKRDQRARAKANA